MQAEQGHPVRPLTPQSPEIDPSHIETERMFRDNLTDMIHKMMFVSGETAEPSVETTTLIEEIVRQQVIEIVVHPNSSQFIDVVN